VSSTLIQNSICPEWQRAVRAEQGGKGSGRGGRGWSGTHGAATVAEEEDRAPCPALRAQALGAGGRPAPRRLADGSYPRRLACVAAPSSILGGQSTTGRESSRVTGWTKRATPEPIRNRTDSIASSPDQTARALTGDVALSVSPLL